MNIEEDLGISMYIEEYTVISRTTKEYRGIAKNIKEYRRNTKEYQGISRISRHTKEYLRILPNTKEYRGISAEPDTPTANRLAKNAMGPGPQKGLPQPKGLQRCVAGVSRVCRAAFFRAGVNLEFCGSSAPATRQLPRTTQKYQ